MTKQGIFDHVEQTPSQDADRVPKEQNGPPTSTLERASQAGVLNFVFETGSGVRKGGHNVRSQAAKFGWTSRQRLSKKDSQQVANKPATKRRKVQHLIACEEASPSISEPFRPEPPSTCVPINSRQQTPPTPTPTTPNGYGDVAPTSLLSRDSPATLTWSQPSWNNATYLPSPLPSPNCEKPLRDASCKNTNAHETSPRRRRSSSPSFFEVVLNEEHPIFNHVNHLGDPFRQFPVAWKPLYGSMIERYRAITAAQVQAIVADDSFRRGVCNLPLQLCVTEAEPALLFGIMGTTGTMLEAIGAVLEVPARFFRSETVRLLNTALDDPKRVFTSSIILAVALISLSESTSGVAGNRASVYSAALKTMVNARGGLERIYFTDDHGPMFVRFLVWLDKVVASQSGGLPVFADWDDAIERATSWDGVWDRMRTTLSGGDALAGGPHSEIPP